MNTRPDERLFYLELARQGARVERRLAPKDLARLSSIAHIQEPVDVVLEFSLDEQGRVRVSGQVEARVRAECQRCLEDFDRLLRARVNVCIAREPQAGEVGRELDVFTADADSVSCVDLVEDQLILDLPERLCQTEPCPHAPQLHYPAAQAAERDAGKAEEDNPFSVLATLKDKADS